MDVCNNYIISVLGVISFGAFCPFKLPLAGLDFRKRAGITVYRPPVSDNDPVAILDIKVLIDCLQQLCDIDSAVIVSGDFNLPNINWADPVLSFLKGLLFDVIFYICESICI